ncbi:hypothetical protein RY831_15585 [Noviherbaspirillum sp. CPCC 100848]|uniref:Uncharacterized protein n=1 Tax=Noviherbaspirillum album TaxID=3080276 RepID=A0ABU6JAM4_9BURK|nr:hypothetical protein [Noviherbaspirillum sp. CPCC 100848]MEC4720585.1 hypothetical protein [Noviherbaspirillum sp. CPCC 100848]
MSVVTVQSQDKSNFLCKRFAAMASDYFDAPSEARTPAAQVPLENLFRVLEMFRNNTFFDEPRKGVFAFEKPKTSKLSLSKEDSWHVDIKDAVHRSIEASFGKNVGEAEAVVELQNTLRWLVVPGDLPLQEEKVIRAKKFFGQLSNAL